MKECSRVEVDIMSHIIIPLRLSCPRLVRQFYEDWSVQASSYLLVALKQQW